MQKLVNVTDDDVQVSENYLPEAKARTAEEWAEIKRRVEEANAEFDAEHEAERRRRLRILDQVDAIYAEPDSPREDRQARVNALLSQLKPARISLDRKVLAEEIQATMERPDLSLHEKLSAVQTLQRYPLRSYMELPDGTIEGDLDLYREIQEYTRDRHFVTKDMAF